MRIPGNEFTTAVAVSIGLTLTIVVLTPYPWAHEEASQRRVGFAYLALFFLILMFAFPILEELEAA